jgi:RNA polymerase sigma-70 factor, ECF subfamily
LASDFAQALIALLPRLRRFGVALTGSTDSADDLVQAACERALRNRTSFVPGTRLDSWVFRIMQNLWVDNRRQRTRRGGDADDDETLALLQGEDGRRSTECAITLTRVLGAMDHLPDEQRAVLVAVCVEGLSYAEAADMLDVPVGTVMSRLFRARRALGTMLDLPAGTPPIHGGD